MDDTLAQITPSRNVWTTLQICHSGSFDANGNFVLPTLVQERYMIYDAIINGARSELLRRPKREVLLVGRRRLRLELDVLERSPEAARAGDRPDEPAVPSSSRLRPPFP